MEYFKTLKEQRGVPIGVYYQLDSQPDFLVAPTFFTQQEKNKKLNEIWNPEKID